MNFVNERFITATIPVTGFNFYVICCYSPTEDKPASTKENFYSTLHKLIDARPNKQEILILGDMNATCHAASSYTRMHGSLITLPDNTVCNDNGHRLINLARLKDLTILNTWYNCSKPQQMLTWHSPDEKNIKCIDYAVRSKNLRKCMISCRVRNSFDFNSDHRLLISTFCAPIRKIDRFKKM